MSNVITPTFYPAGPLTAAYAHLSLYHPKANGTLKVPFAGRGKLIHVEAQTITAVASNDFAMEIQNDADVAIGDITVGTSTSAVGDTDTWTADATSDSSYIIDNGDIKVATSSLASAGAVMLTFILEPSIT